MSYQVFARKYRPQTFSEVIGQDHVVRTLANAIERDRLAHAYLFVGPRGTGKTSTARILAKALNCVTGPTVNPCGRCASCLEIALGSSLDVIEIDGASNNGVEQVRELRENARFAPARDRYKIYIIDEVHMLSAAAFNALLKTLEEPPAHVKFVFATTEVHKVLPTILSRCQRFDLRRIPDAKIAAHLLHIAAQEDINLEPRAAEAVARGADGGMRDAESMLDQLVAFCGNTIREEDVIEVFGFSSRGAVLRFADLLLSQNAPGTLAEIAAHEEAGHDLARLTGDLISHFRNLLVAKVDSNALSGQLDKIALEEVTRQAEIVSRERLLELISQFAEAETKMRWASNKRLHLEVSVIKAIQYLGETTLAELLSSLTSDKPLQQENRSISHPRGPAATQEKTTHSDKPVAPLKRPSASPKASEYSEPHTQGNAAGDAAPLIETPDLATIWQEVLAKARDERPFASHWIAAGYLLAIEKGVARIGFSMSEKAACDSLRTPAFSSFLEALLSEVAGLPLKVVLFTREDLPPRTTPQPPSVGAEMAQRTPVDEPDEEKKRLIEEFENDPKIIAALELFEGTLKRES